MRLHIQHATTYSYANPVTFHRHRLVIRPREGHDLRVERWALELTPAHRLEWVRDVFGNSVALVDFLAPADALTIATDVVLERTLPFPSRELHEPWRVGFPPAYEPLETPVTSLYGAPMYGEDVEVVQEWLKRTFVPDPADAEGSMLTLCRCVFKAVRYQQRSEKGVQTPGQTLTLKTGSCRDMATLMMEAARLCGVAARFASGYLHGTASMAGHASTHAWTEIYLPTLGWRGFDPTLGGPAAGGHIVTGVSHHPRGVMPVSGTYSGRLADYRGLQVRVKTALL